MRRLYPWLSLRAVAAVAMTVCLFSIEMSFVIGG